MVYEPLYSAIHGLYGIRDALNDPLTRWSAVISAIGTVASAYYAFRAASDSRRTAEIVIGIAQMPLLIIESMSNFSVAERKVMPIELIVRNVGRGPAKNVQISISGNPITYPIDFVFENQPMKMKIPAEFSKNIELVELLSMSSDDLSVDVSYQSVDGQTFSRKFQLTLIGTPDYKIVYRLI